jgi:hypothetical protein
MEPRIQYAKTKDSVCLTFFAPGKEWESND